MRLRAKHEACLLALEAGIEIIYQSYVKPIKAGRSDGRLLEDQKQRARNMAVVIAKRLAKDKNLDLMQILGVDYIDVWIARIIQRRRA